MDVPDGLAAMDSGVENDSVPAVSDALRYRDLVGVRDEVGQQTLSGRRQCPQIRVVLARDHEDVDGSLRIDVTEGDRRGSAGHDSGRYFGSGDAAEQTIRHAEDLNVWQA